VLENKKVIIDNFQDKETAIKVIDDAIAFYKQNYKDKRDK
jgi:inorganic pyrophosphatase